MQPGSDDQLWLAMQYVSGDLADDKAEAFEAAMSEDVALCEAVLLATRLNAGVVLACDSQQAIGSVRLVAEPLGKMPAASDRPLARFGVFIATASMVMAIIVMMTVRDSATPEGVVAADDAAADMLALLLQSASSGEVNAEYEDVGAADDSMSSLVAPEWLLTAVDLDSDGSQEELPVIGPDDESGVY